MVADMTVLDRDSLIHLAEALGNPLTLLVYFMPRLSMQHWAAAQDAQAALVQCDMSDWSPTIDDTAVVALAASCPQLSSLNLSDCHKITDAAVAALAASCPQLSSLNLCGCHKITDEALAALAASCPQLSSLILCGCHKITDAAVVALVTSCPQLSSLDLYGCLNITDAAMASLAASCDVHQVLRECLLDVRE